MAVLSNTDFQWMKQWVNSKPTIKLTFKTWPLNKSQWKTGFQAIEDWEVGGFSTRPAESLQAAIEAETGAATDTQRKHMKIAWAAWSIRSF